MEILNSWKGLEVYFSNLHGNPEKVTFSGQEGDLLTSRLGGGVVAHSLLALV